MQAVQDALVKLSAQLDLVHCPDILQKAHYRSCNAQSCNAQSCIRSAMTSCEMQAAISTLPGFILWDAMHKMLLLVTVRSHLLLLLLLVVESHHCLLGLSIHRLQQCINLTSDNSGEASNKPNQQ